jgi:Zn-finger nucleic acid-binding protein
MGAMVKFKVICPECWAAVVTAHPEALVWDLCPQCRHHVGTV